MNKRQSFLPYGQQWIEEDDIAAVIETLKSPYLTTGPKIAQFEQAVADYAGAAYAVAFANGTAALHGACYAAGIAEGDEVITTPITFAASANCARYFGASIVFADIDEKTYNIDPDQLIRSISPKTKAIVPVDFTGQPCDIDTIMDIAKRYGLVVIQDGAHSLGAEYKGKRVGTQADMTMFSFHPVKPVTTAEGGVIVTDNPEYYEKLKLFRTHGIATTTYAKEQGDWYYEMVDLGFNYRMTDLQAALGISQMGKLQQFIERRRELAALYTKLLRNVRGVTPPYQAPEALSGWHLYSVQLNEQELGMSRKQIFDQMRSANIGVHVHYIPVYWFPYYQRLGYEKGLCPVAEKWYEGALTLPLYPKMTDQDVHEVVAVLKNIIG
ncbi:UDP-4-amino-4,6-dideoxy-N-acetyl-beta-L-altrosami ne transaminase [Paenibacillus montaniterrae]|uniref:UDP-4-amino-4, 6-dideoxy-N-acetyl-beta-L-altrosami ne transaminase n=1 Tax=Paenibacillus montaniterrae TaxID=429341 RepID=A0A920D116_9BACL|nr:UDP-4-amino-4,6-dideoxy-N-acetyl-beta-L-altrosamine transaminase [Paenibacillus montaniterrae]GIP19118.1 UDP-4-amino-4,6-dideoxy-N-acetyl-beta-L-altrosami ne transaminase [Paenibacillus montaniterrae]